jgi:hypothetical protein
MPHQAITTLHLLKTDKTISFAQQRKEKKNLHQKHLKKRNREIAQPHEEVKLSLGGVVVLVPLLYCTALCHPCIERLLGLD